MHDTAPALDDLLRSVRSDPLERLRWIVSRAFSVPVWSLRDLPDDEILLSGVHLILDLHSHDPGDPSDESGMNPAFDQRLFTQRKTGKSL